MISASSHCSPQLDNKRVKRADEPSTGQYIDSQFFPFLLPFLIVMDTAASLDFGHDSDLSSLLKNKSSLFKR